MLEVQNIQELMYKKSDINILLSEPLCPRDVTWGKFKKGAGNNTFSYGLANIASYCIKEGFKSIKFVEPQIEEISEKDYFNLLKKEQFKAVGITSTTTAMDYTYNTFKLIKKALPNAYTILGGIHATTCPEESLKECDELDIVCIGEGEATFADLLREMQKQKPDLSQIKGIAYRENGKIVFTQGREVIKNLDDIPVPSYNLFPMDKYQVQITTAKVFPTFTMLVSRGCTYRCTFCNATEVHGKQVRYNSPEKVVNEVLLLRDKFGAKGIAFMDSTFTISKKFVNEFCDLMIERKVNLPWSCLSRTDTVNEEMLKKMKKAGCWGLTFGIESGNQKSLDLIKKANTVEQNTKMVKIALKLGFFIYATYIICLPGETKKDALNTIKYAKMLGTQSAMFYLPVPFPQTELFKACEADGGIRKDAGKNNYSDFNSWNFDNPVYVNPLIGKEEMQKIYNYAYRSYFTRPIVLWRNLKEINSKDGIIKYFHAARCVLHI